MRLLGARGLHDLADERWNAYGQLTYISSWKPSFPASYTNRGGSINSLSPAHESSFTFTATLFLGVKLCSTSGTPGFDADRGPVHVFGLRLHAQY